jgi:hypothetical protein
LKSISKCLPVLTTANMILRIFRMTAPTPTLPGFPAALSQSAKSRKTGFVRKAQSAGMYRAFRIRAFPTSDIRGLPLTDEPDSNRRGVIPQITSNSRLLAKSLAADNSPKNVPL